MAKGKPYCGIEKEIILKVLAYFEKEKQNGSPMIPVERVLDRTSEATGVSIRTIRNIRNEARNIVNSEPGSSGDILKVTFPKRKKKKKSGKELKVDDGDLRAIKNIVEGFYVRKEVPTISKILKVAKKELNFPGQKTTLRKILQQKLGYKFKNKEDERPWESSDKEYIPLEPQITIIEIKKEFEN